MKRVLHIAVLLISMGAGRSAGAQCVDHSITITAGTWPDEVSWQLVAPAGGVVASGFAPTVQIVCLPPGCYTMYMFDLFGDGWNGATFTIRVLPGNAVVSTGTLNAGTDGLAQVNIGGGCDPPGCVGYNLTLTGGAYPAEISWNLVGTTSVIATGSAPSTTSICVLPGCYTMQMFDDFGDGWNGATWALTTTAGATVASGTLGTGSIGISTFGLGVPAGTCATQGPVVASDCPQAVNVCTNINFMIDPNGSGSLNEIPPLGSLGNPDLLADDLAYSAWGSDNWGCLRNNEFNSTWMVVNIETGGSLEFIFGGLDTQVGFYDWIMYPYNTNTCSQVSANAVAPVRCNWNGVAFGGTGLVSTIPPGGDVTNYEPPLNVVAGQQYLICFSNWSSVTTTVPLVFGGTAVVSCSPLPVELISFEAIASTERVDLEWVTATESSSLRFDVERSMDHEHWTVIGTLAAAGHSERPTHYRLPDGSPLTGQAYYRLRMLDMDGSYDHSMVLSVFREPGNISCHPNPSNGSFSVHGVSEDAVVEVMDIYGRPVAASLVWDRAGAGHVELDQRKTGWYTIRIGSRTGRLLVVAP